MRRVLVCVVILLVFGFIYGGASQDLSEFEGLCTAAKGNDWISVAAKGKVIWVKVIGLNTETSILDRIVSHKKVKVVPVEEIKGGLKANVFLKGKLLPKAISDIIYSPIGVKQLDTPGMRYLSKPTGVVVRVTDKEGFPKFINLNNLGIYYIELLVTTHIFKLNKIASGIDPDLDIRGDTKVKVDFGFKTLGKLVNPNMRNKYGFPKYMKFTSIVDAMNYLRKNGWRFVGSEVVVEDKQHIYHYTMEKVDSFKIEGQETDLPKTMENSDGN